ncbi:hypothetical protein SAMN05216474_0358 [Lishizhenia tianjinensis]|uniref:Uncharacterized protein n=1 Tax=Lishizhenia tianjinensis TaxID=477690 RepID=A0A1I6XPS4_9FLAO|nr:hypothetical protein [Lishizhenia tianjinensis]SFT40186.1 hypothetical protein SAMN05216474_0358 [Lishizhenia tianjinensis]
MTEQQNNYLELSDSGDLVRLESIELIKYDSDIDWDKNWLKTQVTVKGGKFSGQYLGEFMTFDFEKLKQELSRLYDNLKGTANFNDLEGYLELKIEGDGIGHYEVEVKACDQPGINESTLTFTMNIDQTELKELINQLDRITQQFPITGDIKI